MAARTDERHFFSATAGAAQALAVGVLHLVQTTAVAAMGAVRDIAGEVRSAVARTASGSVAAAEDIGGDLTMVGRGVWRGVGDSAREITDGIAALSGRKRGTATTTAKRRRRDVKARGRRRRHRAA